jgi:phenylalanyl-tRNA synthetase, beta subunit, non-spirochete bacterial
MKLPFSLLKTFLPLELPLSQIGEALTLLGIEVDAIHQEKPPFHGVVAAEVLSAKPHPNAEKLQIAEVSDGSSIYQIVCGASNCRAGLKTALARIGATLYDNHGQPFVIKAAKLRGIESFGMLCSAAELLGSEEHDGIMELGTEIKIGEDLLSHLWDPVFELSLTPNLGYCLSARGVARELSASLNLPMKKISHRELPAKQMQTQQVSVETPHLCPKYMGRTIEGVKIGPSPFWLQQTLKAANIRPINNAVDITNYILLKWGQPMHAFDADLLEGSIHVRAAKKETPFLCLDDIERLVPEGTLLICDEKKPVALAGLMGGANSSVSEQTTKIFLEAAFFDPTTIRTASKKLNLRSESSLRFEKGIDPEAMTDALDEASALFISLCSGHLLSGTIDTHPAPFAAKEISCRSERVNKILGANISVHEIEEIFHRLHFKTKKLEGDGWLVSVPLYRSDLTEEIDLIEEVARIYGYNSLETPPPFYTTTSLPHDPAFLFEKKTRPPSVGPRTARSGHLRFNQPSFS